MQASEKWARRIVAEPAVFLACPVLHLMVVLFEFYVSCCIRRGTFSLPSRRVPVPRPQRCQNFISTIHKCRTQPAAKVYSHAPRTLCRRTKRSSLLASRLVAVVGVAAAAYYSTSSNAGVRARLATTWSTENRHRVKRRARNTRRAPQQPAQGPPAASSMTRMGPFSRNAPNQIPRTVCYTMLIFIFLLLILLRVAPVQLNEADIEKLSPEVRFLVLAT
jgi:hypothetical protein